MKGLDLNEVLGEWQVRRRISDAPTGLVTRFQGTAQISDSTFHETGMIQFQNQRLSSQRQYLLEWSDGAVEVRRPDGSPFITLEAQGIQRVVHHCGDDLYRGLFMFASNRRWAEIWTVRGPRKNYRSVSQYWR